MFKIAKDRNETGEIRGAVVEALNELMDERDDVLALDADLGGASGLLKVQAAHPNQFIDCGIAESNMIGVAAGLSSEGFTPFCHTFAPFASRRVFDQVYMSGAYAHNTVNIWGSDSGFTAAHNGGTHTTYEDVAMMRTIPGAWVCDPADAVQMRWIVREFCSHPGVHYVRGNRKAVRNVYDPSSTFEIGRGNVLREGKDLLIIAAGQLVSEALDAGEEFDATVIDMFCIKPLDTELILKHAEGKKLVCVFENHGKIGGLGEAVGTVLAEKGAGVPLFIQAPSERFGQVGSASFLQKEYGLDINALRTALKEHL